MATQHRWAGVAEVAEEAPVANLAKLFGSRSTRLFGLEVTPDAAYGAVVAYAPATPVYDWEGITVVAHRLDEGGHTGHVYFAQIKAFKKVVLGVFDLFGVLTSLGVPCKMWVALFSELPAGDYELVLNGPVRKIARATVSEGKVAQVRFVA
jgi:hypothetical protein